MPPTAPVVATPVGSEDDRARVAAALRIGRVDFLNMVPMHRSLGLEPELSGVPTDINRAIAEGEVDAACMSAIEYARHADELVLLPSLCVSADGAVGSIFAISEHPLEDVVEWHVTAQSATSVVLLQVLSSLRGGRPEVHLLEGDPADVLAAEADASRPRGVLLIGDDALQAQSRPELGAYTFTDLGERWLAETGLPMVYAVWAVRRDAVAADPDAARILDRLLAGSVRRFAVDDEAVADAAAAFGIDEHAARGYFDRLCYAFGQPERKGLLRFLRMAREANLLGAVPRPEFVEHAEDHPAADEDGHEHSSAADALVPGALVPDEHDGAATGDDAAAVHAMYARSVGSKVALRVTPEDEAHVERCLDMEADARSRDVDDVLQRALKDERIDEVDAIALLQSDRLVDVGQVAHELRLRRTDPDSVTFIVDRNINYTNYCVTDCGFCAFYRRPGDTGDGYLHSTETLLEKIRETVELGGTAALMQGGHNPDLDIDWYVDFFRAVKREFPTFHMHALSPPEVQHIARRSKLSIPDTLAALRDAGMDSLPGGGGEVLIDRVRRVMAPKKTKANDWLDIMRVAHRMGMSTSASLMYGHVELLAERAIHMKGVRDVQDEQPGFRSFTSWTFQPGNTPLAQLLRAGQAPFQRHLPPTPTAFTYLLTQAVSRIFLDNIDNVQSSWVTQGMKVGQAALMFGANDMGSIMIEENVVSSAGTTYRATTEDFVQSITAAGYRPVQRDTLYRTVREH